MIVYNASSHSYAQPFERRLLYTVCTRAMHALVVNYIGLPSRFLAGSGVSRSDSIGS